MGNPSKTSLSFLFLSLLLLPGCLPASKYFQPDLSQPRDFFRNLYEICKNERYEDWCEQLSSAKCEQFRDHPDLHYTKWCTAIRLVVEDELKGNFRKEDIYLTGDTLKVGSSFRFLVIREDGLIKLNEI